MKQKARMGSPSYGLHARNAIVTHLLSSFSHSFSFTLLLLRAQRRTWMLGNQSAMSMADAAVFGALHGMLADGQQGDGRLA